MTPTDRPARIRLGVILPSSNTVVEPVTIAVLAGLQDVSVHFARFALTKVTVSDPAAAYYGSGLLLGAARLLADARCDVITWNGSAGGLVGFDLDRQLCADIARETGSAATTTSLSVLDAFRAFGVRRFGLATLNPGAMNDIIIGHFAREGFECAASTARDDLVDNFAMAAVETDAVTAMVEDCAAARPHAVLVFGTNTRGASLPGALEPRLGLPIFDSVTVGVWGALRRAGVDTRPLRAWGRLFCAG